MSSPTWRAGIDSHAVFGRCSGEGRDNCLLPLPKVAAITPLMMLTKVDAMHGFAQERATARAALPLDLLLGLTGGRRAR